MTAMAEKYHIVRQDHAHHGRYVIALAEGFEAEATYRKLADNVMSIDHTGVPPEFGGRGIAAQLIEAIVSDARREGFRILPHCSYAVAQFRRHPEWADLRAPAPK